MLNADFSAGAAEGAGQGAGVGFRQVADEKTGGIFLVGGAHGGDQRNLGRFAGPGQFDFSGHRINGVDDIVIGGEIKLAGGFGREENRNGFDLRVGTDVFQPFFHGLGLVPPQGGVKSDNLSVEIADADRVRVHQREMSDSAPAQGFGDVTAHTADTEEDHAAVFQLFNGAVAQDDAGTAVKILHTCFLSGSDRLGRVKVLLIFYYIQGRKESRFRQKIRSSVQTEMNML